MFLECSANDKTADNKGVLFSPKRLVFEAKCEKSLNDRGKISGIKMKLQKYKPQLHCKRSERCCDRLSGHLSAFGLKAATLATFSKKKVKKADCFDAIVFTNLTLAVC